MPSRRAEAERLDALSSPELSPARIASAKAWLEDALLHSGRVEEDEIYETALAALAFVVFPSPPPICQCDRCQYF